MDDVNVDGCVCLQMVSEKYYPSFFPFGTVSRYRRYQMKDQSKTKQVLIQELASLKQKIRDLERSESERKQVEEALRESEGRFRQLADTAPVLIWMSGPDKGCTYFNRVWLEFTGRSLEQELGNGWLDGVHPEDLQRCLDIYFSHFDARREFLLEYRLRRADGEFRWVRDNGVPRFDGEGFFLGYVGSCVDITDNKQVEEMLQKVNENMNALIESMPDAIFFKDGESRWRVINEAAKKLFKLHGFKWEGKSERELANMRLEFRNAHENCLIDDEKAWDAGTLTILNEDMIGEDGKVRNFEVRKMPLFEPNGRRKALVIVGRDITERKQADEALKENEEQYRSFVENASDIVFKTDDAGHFTFVNPAALRITGYKEEEVIGKHYPTLIHPDMRDEAIKFFGRQFVKEIQNTYLEYRILTKDDHEVWLGQNTQLIVKDGHVIGFQAVARDITERKRVQDTLKQSEEKFRFLTENMNDNIFMMDMNLRTTYVSQSIKKILGFTPEERMKQHITEQVTPASMTLIEKILSEELEREQKGLDDPDRSAKFEMEYYHKDGSTVWMENVISGIRDDQGVAVGIYGVSRDITERKQAEEVLRENQARLDLAIRSADMGVWHWDIIENKRYFDDQVCHLLGINPATFTGAEEEFIGAVHPDDRETIKAALARTIEQDVLYEPEYRVVWSDGSTYHMAARGRLVRDDKGRPLRINGIIWDITERKRVEENLKRTLESLRKAFSTTVQVMVSAVEVRDPYTAGHQIRSADLARAIATEMGLPQEKIDGIRMAGSIHDIGKLSIPAEILSKPTKLTNIEFSLIKEHARSGYEMLKDVESPWPLAQIVYQHHERMNGSGYPRNLKGDDILMEARIMAVADTVEAMASHRPYRPSLGIDVALGEIEKNRGTLYDNAVADACMKLFREKGYQLP